MSPQGSEENCTPQSGPAGRKLMPGGKCSWMMKPAVRVENALPVVLKNAAVAAFAVAASTAGATVPSSPCPAVPTLRIVVVAGAPGITNKPITLPSRSVTTIVTDLPREVAAEAACWRIVWMSVDDKLVASSDDGGGGDWRPGVGTAFRSSGGPPPTSPMPTRTRLLATLRYLSRTRTSPVVGRLSGTRIMTDETHGLFGTGSMCSTVNE